MGFFENLGRKVGEVTHEAKQTAAEQATHACTDCGERFYTAQTTCPECGSDAIVERTRTSNDDSDAAGSDADGADTSAGGSGREGDDSPAEPEDDVEPAALIEEAEADRTDER